MKNTTALYKALRKDPNAWYEVQIIQGAVTYGSDRLKSVKLFPALFDGSGPQIGNTVSTSCEITLVESSANWPRMAQFSVRLRLSSADGTQKSEWLSMGTYYTDERREDAYGNLSITAYDGMLLTEQYWTDKIREEDIPASWPITSKAWADMMVNAGLVEIDSRTVLDDTAAIIGLNTASTIRDNLKTIAAAHGGNWQITPEGRLRLIPLVNMVDGQAAIAGIAIAGISVVGDGVIESAEGLDYAFLGMDVQTFENSPALDGITGVNLETEAGNVAAAGTTTGYVLNASCEFASSVGAAELCLSKVQGYIYKPFSAGRALLDPAAEVGDLVIINGRSYQMMAIDWNINTWPTADIGAAYEQEVDHEYTILSPEAKNYRKTMAATDEKLTLYPTTMDMQSAISQSESRIELSVSQTYVTIEDYDETIENLQEQIDGSITQYSGEAVPTLNNYPAQDWTTTAERQQHVGSLYLVTAGEQRGQYYRFEQSGSNFAWVLVEDSALATALARAAEAQAAAEQAIADAETAQAAAEAAQGTADQARLDAVARAAEAQAAAITQAAVDATNKANDALAAAQAYAQQQVDNFINGEYADDLGAIRGQLDRKIETFYQASDPSTDWETPSEHIGDLWYDMTTQLYKRWNGTGWDEVTANPPDDVFDTLDGKARIFIEQPVPPYSVGDVWAQGANGDILRCVYAKSEGQVYDASDWTLASKYTDDSNLQSFITGQFAEALAAIKAQVDQKAETFYGPDDPSLNNGISRWDAVVGRAVVGTVIVGSTKETHVGDMWYCTATDDPNHGPDTTWYWDGTQWIPQTISRELFDAFDGKAYIFVSQPVPPYREGDLWVQGETGDILRCKAGIDRQSGSYVASDWELASKYTDNSAFEAFRDGTYANFVTSTITAINGKITTYYQSNQPSSGVIGDLWIDTDDNNKLYRYNGSSWVSVRDAGIQSALNAAANAQTTADGKIVTFAQNNAPTASDIGDLWIDTDDNNKLYRWSGSQWVAFTDTSALQSFVNGTYATFVTSTTTALNSKITTFYQANQPTATVTGDLWIDTDDKNKLYRWSGSSWVAVRDTGIQEALTAASNAQTTADGKIVTFAQTSQPTATDVGDLWIDTDDNNKLYRWSGSTWIALTDSSALQTFITQNYNVWQREVNGQLDGKIETYYQATNPATAWTDSETQRKHEGDLWYCTTDTLTDFQKDMTYRWTETSTNVYEWEEYGGVPSEVFNKINGKAQVFMSEPVDPLNPTKAVGYNRGDFWIMDDGTILTCLTPREENDDYDPDDWTEYIKYVGQESVDAAKDAMNSKINGVDSKWETRDAVTQTTLGRINETVTVIGTHLSIDSDAVRIYHDQNQNVLRMTGSEIAMLNGTDVLTYWNTSEMYTPKKVRIPTTAGTGVGDGGSLQIGGLLFQPRSNGNMSVMWVGEN